MRYLFLFFSLLTLSSCGRCKFDYCVPRCVPASVQEQMTRHATATATKFHFEERLFFEDSKYYCNPGQIYAARFDFSSMALLELKEARELLVDVVEDYLARVNSDPLIQPYLINGALSGDDMQVYVNFKSFWGLYLDFKYVGWITLERGCSNFYAFNMRSTKTEFVNWRSEAYINSEEIVRISREEEAAYLESIAEEDFLSEERYRPDGV